MTKLFCTEMGKRAADHAVQIFGGLGRMDETLVSGYYRDIRGATITDGTSEIRSTSSRAKSAASSDERPARRSAHRWPERRLLGNTACEQRLRCYEAGGQCVVV